ncbi:HlyD family type I secretion periplasmic adaptor subunit [Afipia felis]|uniref:Membrane fusion protein (MFP) family protein n=2 Tax=Afipia felis TaxID=1035 RepID=A0A380WAF4_AFIFE|nr:HlyD family type I secretion periplasmic adaptor subunit [Afipia felis]EKS29198.1 HlyD family type I secretion membrane fusion protein [Afipia felis ATCC 53690]SUU77905.1 Type I secretion system membrane fusion protein PrsE [Afipia felis]SUU85970.1 Type I secretion system membrane fusion protein PrsE [Afipia felis]
MTAVALPPSSQIIRSTRRHVIAGAIVLITLTCGFGGWAAITNIAGAVIATGTITVDSNVKKVQHLTAGIVGELHVRDGDEVKAGQVLIRLDDTVPRANLAVIVKSLDELTAREARLTAERDGSHEISFPKRLLSHAQSSEAAHLMAGETRLFIFRSDARQGQKKQLQEQIIQLREQIRGYIGQVEAGKRQNELIQKEIEGVGELWKKNLVPLSRLTALQREAARLDGENNRLTASIAESRGKISEIELKIIQIDQDLRSDVARELREIQGKIAELDERRIAAEDELKRIDIRAPQDGIIHELSVHTIGGVVSPGEQILLVVPDHDALMAETKVAPRDINNVSVGQRVVLRFPAFDIRTTPEINGTVTIVSADATQDQKSDASYYRVRIQIPSDEIGRLGKNKLVPGMPVESFIETTPRTALSYFVKPLRDQITKAFRG